MPRIPYIPGPPGKSRRISQMLLTAILVLGAAETIEQVCRRLTGHGTYHWWRQI